MLYILMVICAISMGVYLYYETRQKYVIAVILKGVASLCFVTCGIVCSKGSMLENMVLCGLILGAIADVFLNLRYVSEKNGKLIFIMGILVFLAGHIVYLASMLTLSVNWPLSMAVGAVLAACLITWLFKVISADRSFKALGVVYLGAIVLLNAVAVGNTISQPSAFRGAFATGAFLFLVSDIVLIINVFGDKYRQSFRIINTILYYGGQMIIAMSLLLL
ncbi:lysoplasmalogenase [Butyrivibrio proteoclasticus]|uniref:lysoplasmalogenase n=1 Tax=Butyrivibrio proteoclasticus TaxID=43305 RepID=UPI000A9C9A79|nr:lysoplasmalogenase [Butyrivibrio proteoclasticus]